MPYQVRILDDDVVRRLRILAVRLNSPVQELATDLMELGCIEMERRIDSGEETTLDVPYDDAADDPDFDEVV